MGANDPNFPATVASQTAADVYLALRAAVARAMAFAGLTGSPTATAAQIVDATVEISGGAAATLTLDTAANIIARMQALDPNAAVGSTFEFSVVNSNSGTLTVTPGANTTFASVGGGSILTLVAFTYIVKWATTTTVTLARKG